MLWIPKLKLELLTTHIAIPVVIEIMCGKLIDISFGKYHPFLFHGIL